jgi:TPP-dependent pyruvate/acetoin dehydrogenase alpha subunit
MKGTDQASLCFFGDGASNTGAFHEGLNLAAVWNLPVIFICQNNLYAESTPQRVHQKICDIAGRGPAYGIPGLCINGNEVVEVYEATSAAVKRAREGLGPTLLECKTYRWLGHYVGDPSTAYRTRDEVEEWKKKDPVKLYRAKLLEMAVCTARDLDEIDQRMEKEIDEAVMFAQSSQEPEAEDALNDIYVGPYIP